VRTGIRQHVAHHRAPNASQHIALLLRQARAACSTDVTADEGTSRRAIVDCRGSADGPCEPGGNALHQGERDPIRAPVQDARMVR